MTDQDEQNSEKAKAAAAQAGDRIRALPVKARNRLLFELLQEAGASGIVIPGDNGVIEGYLADRTVALKYLKNKSWTIETVWLMQAVFSAKGAGSWVDLGANIGTTVIPAALAGATCHVVEADPGNLALLNRNIARNGVADRIRVHEAAVWDREDTLSFEIAPSNLGDHRVRTTPPDGDNAYSEAGRETISVSARPVDGMIDAAALRGPVMIKLDIQGAEGRAFDGGAALFARADVALLEYWPYGLRRLGTSPETLFEKIARSFSHAGFLADDQKPDSVQLVPFAELKGALLEAEQENRTVALDLVLTKQPELF